MKTKKKGLYENYDKKDKKQKQKQINISFPQGSELAHGDGGTTVRQPRASHDESTLLDETRHGNHGRRHHVIRDAMLFICSCLYPEISGSGLPLIFS